MPYKLLALLPLSLLYVLGDLAQWFVYRVLRYRKDLVIANLRNAFPQKSESEVVAIAKQCYKNCGQLLAEMIKGNTISEAELRRRVIIEHVELVQDYYDAGKPIVLLASHHCNWEWLLLASCLKLPCEINAVYKIQHDKPAETFMLNVRSRFGCNAVAAGDFMVEIMRNKETPRAFALVGDQAPLQDEEKHWATLLGQATPFHVGAQKIARMTKAPVLFVSMRRLRRGYYAATLNLLAEPPYSEDGNDLVDRYAAAVEQQILNSPADWLWLHNRWKYKKPLYA